MPTLIPIMIALVKYGPTAISFIESTYDLFTKGKLTEQELTAVWTNAVNAATAAEAKWTNA